MREEIGSTGRKSPKKNTKNPEDAPDGPENDPCRASKGAAEEIRPNGRWRATQVTAWPEMFPGPLRYSLAGKALADGIWSCDCVNLRDFANNPTGRIDDAPFGGGPGMVIGAEVIDAALSTLGDDDRIKLVTTPRGEPFTQAKAREYAASGGIVVVSGRFAGIDERVIEKHRLEEISVGDYILSGGEPAAIAVTDACVRLLPGVIGCSLSLENESFDENLLEAPRYTRPALWRGRAVPEVLLNGNHAEIEKWRRERGELDTRKRRPDLWRKYLRDRGKTR